KASSRRRWWSSRYVRTYSFDLTTTFSGTLRRLSMTRTISCRMLLSTGWFTGAPLAIPHHRVGRFLTQNSVLAKMRPAGSPHRLAGSAVAVGTGVLTRRPPAGVEVGPGNAPTEASEPQPVAPPTSAMKMRTSAAVHRIFVIKPREIERFSPITHASEACPD